MKTNLFHGCILLCCLGVLACSSAPKQDRSNSEKTASDVSALPETSLAPDEGVIEPAPPPPASQKAVAPTVNSYQALSDAIKSQNDEAIYRSATVLLSQNTNDPKTQNALGLYHYRKGRFQTAQYFFTRAIKAAPTSPDIYNNLGLSLLAQDQKREAIGSFKKSIELDPTNFAAAVNLSSVYIAENDYQKALIPLEMVVKRGTKDHRLLNNYGVALVGLGKYSQAKDQYQAALSVNSAAKDVMLNLAIVQIEHLKGYQEGLDLLNKIRFLGTPEGTRTRINALENTAKTGLTGNK